LSGAKAEPQFSFDRACQIPTHWGFDRCQKRKDLRFCVHPKVARVLLLKEVPKQQRIAVLNARQKTNRSLFLKDSKSNTHVVFERARPNRRRVPKTQRSGFIERRQIRNALRLVNIPKYIQTA
jgi:hypothetical protein